MGVQPPSLLSSALRRYRLTSTVAISLAVHLLAWGIVVWTGALNPAIILAKKPEAKRQLALDFIKPRPKPETTKIDKPTPPPPAPPKPPKKKKLPNVFVQVDPKQASAKKPEDTNKYSNKNSLAANPEPSNKPKPQIDGSQKEISRTHDVPQRAEITPKPAPPTPIDTTKPQKEAKPIPSGATAAKPSDTPDKTENLPQKKPKIAKQAKDPKPKPDNSKKENIHTVDKKPPAKKKQISTLRPARDIASKPAEYIAPKPKPMTPPPNAVKPQDLKPEIEPTLTAKLSPSKVSPRLSPPDASKPKTPSPLERAKRRLAKAQDAESQILPGKATKQVGGVPRKGIPSRDVLLTGYGDYDDKLITAIYNSWVRKNHEARMHEPYRVVVEFELLSSGRIENMRTKHASLSLAQSIPEFICKRSIEEPAPFGRWDEKMKRALGTRRPCRITFSFNIRD